MNYEIEIQSSKVFKQNMPIGVDPEDIGIMNIDFGNQEAEFYIEGDTIEIDFNNAIDIYEQEKLQELKEEFLNIPCKLLELDNRVIEMLNVQNMSIFDYSINEMLQNGFVYEIADNPVPFGFTFEFETIEENEDPLEIIVKVIDIGIL